MEGWINVHVASCPLQFVPFRDYMDRTGNHVLSMARLAKDVLAEIPDQFISYMKSRGIKPNPAPPPYTPPGHTHHTQIWVHAPKSALTQQLLSLESWDSCTGAFLLGFSSQCHRVFELSETLWGTVAFLFVPFIFSAQLFFSFFSSEGWCDPRIWPKGSFFVCFV